MLLLSADYCPSSDHHSEWSRDYFPPSTFYFNLIPTPRHTAQSFFFFFFGLSRKILFFLPSRLLSGSGSRISGLNQQCQLQDALRQLMGSGCRFERQLKCDIRDWKCSDLSVCLSLPSWAHDYLYWWRVLRSSWPCNPTGVWNRKKLVARKFAAEI